MNKQIADEAADWFIEINADDSDAVQKKAFDAWLRKSPTHVQAYMELLAVWEEGAFPLRGDGASIEAVVATARDKDTVVAFPNLGTAAVDRHSIEKARPGAIPTRAVRMAMVAAAALLACGIGFWAWNAGTLQYATAVGEKRLVKLSDGSTVELNTRSKIAVRFAEHERSIDLIAGEALFRVAKDTVRPFVVNVGPARVRAVGTQFDIYRHVGATTVTVLEGRVAIDPVKPSRADPSLASASAAHAPRSLTETAASTPVFLSSGEQLTVTPVLEKKAHAADVTTVTAWTQGRLLFDTTALPEVAREFNRYNTRQMRVDDASLEDFLISGSFDSVDPTSLIRFLKSQDELRVSETSDGIHVSRR